MKAFLRRMLIWAALFAIAIAAGWVAGNSGRSTAQRSLDAAVLRLLLTEARGDVLSARVSLYNVNFGDASRALEEAKARLRQARAELASLRNADAGSRIETILDEIDTAQGQAGKLDVTAQVSAARAAQGIEDILDALPQSP